MKKNNRPLSLTNLRNNLFGSTQKDKKSAHKIISKLALFINIDFKAGLINNYIVTKRIITPKNDFVIKKISLIIFFETSLYNQINHIYKKEIYNI